MQSDIFAYVSLHIFLISHRCRDSLTNYLTAYNICVTDNKLLYMLQSNTGEHMLYNLYTHNSFYSFVSFTGTTCPRCWSTPGAWTARCSKGSQWPGQSLHASVKTPALASGPSLPTPSKPSPTTRGWWGPSSCRRQYSRRMPPAWWRNLGKKFSFLMLVQLKLMLNKKKINKKKILIQPPIGFTHSFI